MPPIELVATPPADASSNADGFVREGDGTIYLVASAEAYRAARCESRRSLLKLASVLAHEEWHVRNGSDERGAYQAQLLAILRLGETPSSPLYRGVYQSMRFVLQKEAEMRRAARQNAPAPERTLARH